MSFALRISALLALGAITLSAQTSVSAEDAMLMGYVHVFRGLQIGKEPLDQYPARRDAYLGFIGLNESQRPKLISIAADFTIRVRAPDGALARLRQQSDPASQARRLALVDQKRALVREMVAALAKQDADAAAILQKHVAEKVTPQLQIPK